MSLPHSKSSCSPPGPDCREGKEKGENPGDVEEPIDKGVRDANSQQASLGGYGVAASAGDSVAIPVAPELPNPVAAGVDPEEGDETKSWTKLSYVIAPMSGAALFGIFSGYLGEQTGRYGSNRAKLCNAFLVASFVSAMSSIIVIACRCLRFCSHPRLVTAAAWMSVASLSFAAILASWPFLEGYLMLAALIPPIVLVGLYLLLGAGDKYGLHFRKMISACIERSLSTRGHLAAALKKKLGVLEKKKG